MYYFLLILAVLFSVAAQILLKISMKNFIFNNNYFEIIKYVSSNFLLWGAIFSYGIGFALYAMVLSKLDLSKVYPISSVFAIILTVSISIIFMNESASLMKLFGIVLCLLGVVIIFK